MKDDEQLELISPPMTQVQRDPTHPLAVIVSCCHGRRYRLRSVVLPASSPVADLSKVFIQAWMPFGNHLVGGLPAEHWTSPLVLPSRFGLPTSIEELTHLAYRIMKECGDHS